MRVICPQCRGKLSLHRPSVAATRVKCRNCGHKFYAGKADEIPDDRVVASRASESAGPAAEAQVAVVTAPADTAFDTELKAEQRAHTRAQLKERRRSKRRKWL